MAEPDDSWLDPAPEALSGSVEARPGVRRRPTAPATSARLRFGAVVLTKENKQCQLDFDRNADRQRNRIERIINRLK
jgi:hypothetical protein